MPPSPVLEYGDYECPYCRGAARDLGLDEDRFRTEVTGGSYAAKIERDVREGVRNDVNVTPKFYVDGKRIDGKLPLEGLEEAIPDLGQGRIGRMTRPPASAPGPSVRHPVRSRPDPVRPHRPHRPD